jgi:competence protein ComFB
MAIKNDMEFHVRAEAQRRRERSEKEPDVCWCSLCEVDILALALNQLPPRYCHERNFGCTATLKLGDDVRHAVARAVQKVSRRPKHRPGRPLSSDDDIRMENYAQKIGSTLVGTVLSPESAACACAQCQADTLAYALNRYPPKYGVSYGGRESYQANYEDFIRHEIGQALAQAMAVVRERPHH